MPDLAVSESPLVQEQLDRLSFMGGRGDMLGLERIERLLSRIGDPHRSLAPTFHVAGTNGKGSTCAFLRAALEASGHRVHVYSSPHLVRFNERIRLAGQLIGDEVLAALLAEVLDHADGIGATFFEVTTAAAFLAFARVPAQACVIEVGLGGRLDATNVLPSPAACGIAQLSLDHEAFLGNRIELIAAEKAGIAKANCPIVTMDYGADLQKVVARAADHASARLVAHGDAWDHEVEDTHIVYRDRHGAIDLARPMMPGGHQADNLALATAMIRHQDLIEVPASALDAAARHAHWPARLDQLRPGPLTALVPAECSIWLDGGHNPAAGLAVANAMTAAGVEDRKAVLIIGMLANKDAQGLLDPLARLMKAVVAVPVPGHECHPPAFLASTAARLGVPATTWADDVRQALQIAGAIAEPAQRNGVILVSGSLYLAGEVLRANEQLPE